MANSVKTFVFMDLEATGINYQHPKITEICMVACHVSSLENPDFDESGKPKLPRVLDKLCLCVDPTKPLNEEAAHITGLNNKMLEDNEKQEFNSHLISLINEFLNRQAQPVCLVAHNGFFYDFPLLKTELEQQQDDISSLLTCLDTLPVFKQLDKENDDDHKKGKGYYSLSGLYRRAYGKDPIDSHYAEGDVLTLIMVFLSKANEILDHVSTYSKKWGDIHPMYS
ncbi:Three prime repair exonuclease 2 [Pelobates cultripes]|uniref:exodeoxyribonuclease III n=1 Tax=Pelobates cultripes TaxID=61616 RepID=A0AAD1WPX7_PELCU|nr:Three prime repair exonuclease 2 [Pelobates cultripes]